MVKELLRYGTDIPNIGAGDYATFDGSEISQIHLAILHIIQKYYKNDAYTKARFVLWLELMNSKHVNGNLVYEWTSSLPSGHPLTTIVNNLYNHFCFRFCWLVSHEYDFTCLPDFIKFVYLIVLGDDNAFSVAREKLDIFNMLTIEKDMALIGMKYTSDDKKTKIGRMKNIHEITFLKRSFSFSPILFRYVAPLSLVSITEMLNWTTKGKEMNSIVVTNVETAYRELSLHKPEIFDVFTKKISAACELEKIKLPRSTSYRMNLLVTANSESHY
jgi:hypothetical protein